MTTEQGDTGATAQPKNINFGDLMRMNKIRQEKVMIVFGDTVRHIEKWERKGMSRRLVAEGLVEAAIAHIYGEERNPREWLSFFRYMMDEARRHENNVKDGLMSLPDPDQTGPPA